MVVIIVASGVASAGLGIGYLVCSVTTDLFDDGFYISFDEDDRKDRNEV